MVAPLFSFGILSVSSTPQPTHGHEQPPQDPSTTSTHMRPSGSVSIRSTSAFVPCLVEMVAVRCIAYTEAWIGLLLASAIAQPYSMSQVLNESNATSPAMHLTSPSHINVTRSSTLALASNPVRRDDSASESLTCTVARGSLRAACICTPPCNSSNATTSS
ncbi:hypothetical protein PENSPDRAFT_650405 [Peniophora sp. CONT]|nr:hypothetical protein PENSPDRAFT_650405 [Peniophora sp. CONT]